MNWARTVYQGAMVGAGLLAVAGTAQAQEGATVSYNVGVVSDYVFRGISQSDEEAALQGGIDVAFGSFYAGAWASTIDFGLDENAEVDFYAGWKTALGPVTLDLGAIYYFYPGLDSSFNGDYLELKAAASTTADALTLGAAIYWSPEFTFTSDASAIYAEINAAYLLLEGLTVSGAVGHQNVDASGYYTDIADGDSADKYTTWNVGLTYSENGFTIDGRLYDDDLDEVQIRGPSGNAVNGKRAVASVKFAF